MRSAIIAWYDSVTDIRRDEIKPVALMFVYGFLAMTSYYILKPARNSVFVDRVGAHNLPYVYILTAIFVSIVMLGYSRYVDRVKYITLLLGTFAFLAANLFAFWWFLESGTLITSGAFYIWGKLYPLLVVSQFWLVGNLLFTTRQAKRLFGLVGLGPIFGGIAGSAIAGRFATVLGTRTLLLVAAGFLGLCAVIVIVLAPRIRSTARVSGRLLEDISGDAFRLLKQSSHLRTIALILALTIVVGTLIDWQFNTAVEMYVHGEDQKTAFFGKFFALLNGGSVLIQLLATGFVLRKFGVGLAMLALPVGLLFSSVGMILAPVLLTAAILKGTEGGIRYSLDQSTRELLYLPVPTAVKYKVKPLIDMAVYRGGTGLGGVILLIVVNRMGFGIQQVAGICIALIGFWVVVTLRMRREFRESVKHLIGVRDVDLDELIVQRLNAETLGEICEVVQHGNEQEVLYALDLLEHNASYLCADLSKLLEHPSAAVRAKAITRLLEIGDESALPAVQKLLHDPSLLVRVEAIHYVCRYGPDAAEEQMATFQQDSDLEVRVAALACPLYEEGSTQSERALRALTEEAASENPAERQTVARELAHVGPLTEGLRQILNSLLHDRDSDVRHAAVQTAGETGDMAFLELLVSRLCCQGEREPAAAALANYGPSTHPKIMEWLRDESIPERVRLELPAVLYHDASQETADELFRALADAPPPLRFRMIKTLDKLRRDREDLSFDQYEIVPLFEREIREGYEWAATQHSLLDGERPTSLLISTVQQRADEAAERALRVLGLRYSLEDLYAAHAGLGSRERIMRERGFELLDNALPREFRRQFDPLLNPDSSLAEIAAVARKRYGVNGARRGEVLQTLAVGPDRWVGLLACFELGCDLPVKRVPGAPFHEHSVVEELLGGDGDSDTQDEAARMANAIQKAELLAKTELFGRLRTKDQAVIAALTDEREFATDEFVFREGEASTELLIVMEGCIVAHRGEVTLFSAHEGQTVGDLALLDGLPRNYDAVAVEPTRVLVLNREAFYNLLKERFQIVRDVLAHISGVVRKVNQGVARSD